jgi:inhibitor of cysteine peptidase
VLRKVQLLGGMVAVLLAVLVTAGCGPARGVARGADVVKADVKEIQVGAQDNGSRIEVEKGQTLVVTLDSNPTTGYSWEVVEGQGTILQQQGEAQFQPSNAGDQQLVGAGGAETFRFEAAGAGEVTLKLIYHRPWEKGVEPLETFSVQVVVR